MSTSTGMTRRDLLVRGLVSGVSLSSLGVLLTACGSDDGGGSGSSDTAASGGGDAAQTTASGVLRVGAATPPTAVDPVTMFDGSSVALVQLVCEYLVWLEPDFTLTPRLASAWAAEDGARTWSFTLQPGVTFSDGTPLDAQTVMASFDRLLDPASKSSALSAFKSVLSPGGVAVRGDDTVVFTLDRPFGDFPYLVSAGNYNAVVLKSDFASDFTTNPIGTGPFAMTSYSETGGARFARNPTYWRDGMPVLDEVTVTFFDDGQAALLALQSGEIDTQVATDLTLATPIANSSDFTIDQAAGTGMIAFTMRVDTPPFDRVEVRQAVAWALDRPGVIETLSSGAGTIGNDHLFAPVYPAAPTDITQRQADAAKVAELLQSAGAQPLSFTLTFDPPSQAYALVIQNQLEQVGIEVQLDEQSSDVFYGGEQEVDTPWLFSAANLVGWAGRPVPSQFIIPMVKTGGVWNGSKYSNPTLDAAADAYDAAIDDTAKAEQAEIIATAMHDDVPVILTYWAASSRAFNSSRFTGIKAHPSAFVDFSEVAQA